MKENRPNLGTFALDEQKRLGRGLINRVLTGLTGEPDIYRYELESGRDYYVETAVVSYDDDTRISVSVRTIK